MNIQLNKGLQKDQQSGRISEAGSKSKLKVINNLLMPLETATKTVETYRTATTPSMDRYDRKSINTSTPKTYNETVLSKQQKGDVEQNSKDVDPWEKHTNKETLSSDKFQNFDIAISRELPQAAALIKQMGANTDPDQNRRIFDQITQILNENKGKVSEQTLTLVKAAVYEKAKEMQDTPHMIALEEPENLDLLEMELEQLVKRAELDEQWMEWLLTSFDPETGQTTKPDIAGKLTGSISTFNKFRMKSAAAKNETVGKNNEAKLLSGHPFDRMVTLVAKEPKMDFTDMARFAASSPTKT